MRIAITILLAIVSAMQADDGGAALIGTRAPELRDVTWLTDHPIRLSDPKGKVVLIRWWTSGGCPFCTATVPALNRFAEEFGDRGLVVIGLYHHKSPMPMTVEYVKEQAEELGLRIPVGIDNGWENLKRWWLESGDRVWTSVSFLLDRKGVIRSVHPGGVYSPHPIETFPTASDDYLNLHRSIEELLDERMPSGEPELTD